MTINSRVLQEPWMDGLRTRPSHLNNDDIWDKMLSGNTRQIMHSLDVCIQAAYFDTPFTHRLERPLIHFEGATDIPGSEGDGPAEAPAEAAPAESPARRRRRQVKEESLSSTTESFLETTTQSTPSNETEQPEENNETNEPESDTTNNMLTLDDIGLSEAGWCFQTEAEQREAVVNFIRTTCPDSTALESFKSVSNSSASEKEGGDEESPGVWDYKDEDADEETPTTQFPEGGGGSDSSSSLPGKGDQTTPQPPVEDTAAETTTPSSE